jgi:hypothetical protein
MELSQEQRDQYSDYLASFDSWMSDARIARFSPQACQQQVG